MGFRERPVDWREFEKLLKALGFELIRQDGTSHRQWEHRCFKGKRRLITVSPHNSPYTKSLLKNMRTQLGMSKNQFFKCLQDGKHARKLAEEHAPSPIPTGNR